MTKREIKKAIDKELKSVLMNNSENFAIIDNLEQEKENILNTILEAFNYSKITYINILSIGELYCNIYKENDLTIRHHIDIYFSLSNNAIVSNELIIYSYRKQDHYKIQEAQEKGSNNE